METRHETKNGGEEVNINETEFVSWKEFKQRISDPNLSYKGDTFLQLNHKGNFVRYFVITEVPLDAERGDK